MMSKIRDLASRPKLFWGLGVTLVVVLVFVVVGVVAVVGGSDDDPARADLTAEGDADGDREATSADGGSTGRGSTDGGSSDDADPNGDGSDDEPGDGPSGSDDETDDGGSGPSSNRSGGDGSGSSRTQTGGAVTSEQICDRVTGSAVSQATGLDIVDTDPAAEDKTPQCRYYFAGADDSLTNATVSVLRPDEDMEGRSGRAAFDHVVNLNRSAGASSGLNISETVLDVGDQSILFENDLLRYGVIRYGERIVTIILTSPSADHAVAVGLASATAPLATL